MTKTFLVYSCPLMVSFLDSPHTPYGHKALDGALEHLHGFYRTSLVLWQCQDSGLEGLAEHDHTC